MPPIVWAFDKSSIVFSLQVSSADAFEKGSGDCGLQARHLRAICLLFNTVFNDRSPHELRLENPVFSPSAHTDFVSVIRTTQVKSVDEKLHFYAQASLRVQIEERRKVCLTNRYGIAFAESVFTNHSLLSSFLACSYGW